MSLELGRSGQFVRYLTSYRSHRSAGRFRNEQAVIVTTWLSRKSGDIVLLEKVLTSCQDFFLTSEKGHRHHWSVPQ